MIERTLDSILKRMSPEERKDPEILFYERWRKTRFSSKADQTTVIYKNNGESTRTKSAISRTARNLTLKQTEDWNDNVQKRLIERDKKAKQAQVNAKPDVDSSFEESSDVESNEAMSHSSQES